MNKYFLIFERLENNFIFMYYSRVILFQEHCRRAYKGYSRPTAKVSQQHLIEYKIFISNLNLQKFK